ncbi:MAG: hypothetical protein N4A62_20050 [Marinisporobacter sp.]|jgi:DNA polymerase/3'-5' exonuclease PolX|nr:hypothetical protein [Marinisporobacter sp.]
MRRPNNMNKKLKKVAKSINASDGQLEQLSNLADQYKNKSQQDIENEMIRMINGFSKKEKSALIKRLQMLKQMTDLVDTGQTKKIDMFIRLLSR